jgi:hypothetical protein
MPPLCPRCATAVFGIRVNDLVICHDSYLESTDPFDASEPLLLGFRLRLSLLLRLRLRMKLLFLVLLPPPLSRFGERLPPPPRPPPPPRLSRSRSSLDLRSTALYPGMTSPFYSNPFPRKYPFLRQICTEITAAVRQQLPLERVVLKFRSHKLLVESDRAMTSRRQSTDSIANCRLTDQWLHLEVSGGAANGRAVD